MNRDDYRCTDHLLSDLWASSYETLSIDLLLFVTTGLIYVKKKKAACSSRNVAPLALTY